jgi:predicted enzyme related to lactoylglutathione lyase
MFDYERAFSGFSVNNLKKAKSFYSEVLALEVADTPMGILEIRLKDGSKIIAYPKPDHEAATFTILNFVVEDIEVAVDALIEKGVVFEQYEGQIKTDEKGICRAAGGPSIAWFKDTAGNILSVLEEK